MGSMIIVKWTNTALWTIWRWLERRAAAKEDMGSSWRI